VTKVLDPGGVARVGPTASWNALSSSIVYAYSSPGHKRVNKIERGC